MTSLSFLSPFQWPFPLLSTQSSRSFFLSLFLLLEVRRLSAPTPPSFTRLTFVFLRFLRSDRRSSTLSPLRLGYSPSLPPRSSSGSSSHPLQVSRSRYRVRLPSLLVFFLLRDSKLTSLFISCVSRLRADARTLIKSVGIDGHARGDAADALLAASVMMGVVDVSFLSFSLFGRNRPPFLT